MDFLKRHYEKIILSVVLVLLAGAAALMPMKVSKERQAMEDRRLELFEKKPKEMADVDISTNQAMVARLRGKIDYEFSGPHNLFNPVKWQKKPDGGLIKIQTGSEVGIGAMTITRIKPLELIVALEDVLGSGDSFRYTISILKETQPPKQSRIVEKGKKTPLFTLQDVKGPPEAPTELIVMLEGDKEPISLNKETPYRRVVGYEADLNYEPEKLVRKNLRVKNQVSFGGETYNIVAINQDEVVLSASSNGKQTTVKYSGAPKQ